MNKNCCQLNISQLSSTLSEKLLKIGQSIKLEKLFNPSDRTAHDELRIRQQYHEQTNTTGAVYRVLTLTPQINLEIKKEFEKIFEPFCSFNFYLQIIDGGQILVPHTDYGRSLSIVYNLSKDDALTHFYNKKYTIPDRYNFMLEEIEGPIETYSLKSETWYILNTGTVHNVTNINQRRIALSGHSNQTYQEFCEHYKDVL